jgi:TPR repeat protein
VDYSKSAEWYGKSAEQGYVIAQNNLGVMYANGQGVHKDYAKAIKWYRKAGPHADCRQYDPGSRLSQGRDSTI